MSHRTSFTAQRRARLARRVESLEAMESRSLITESLGIMAAGIGFGTAALVSPARRAEASPSLAPRPRGIVPLTIVAAPIVAQPAIASGSSTSSTMLAPIALPTQSGDWLTLHAPTNPSVNKSAASTSLNSPKSSGGLTPGLAHASRSPGGTANASPTSQITPLQLAPPSQGAGVAGTAAPVVFNTTQGASPTTGSGQSGFVSTSHTAANSGGTAPLASTSIDSFTFHSGGSPTPLSSGGGGGGFGSTPQLGQFTNFKLYTLDESHGSVLFPGADQIGLSYGPEDLRAQVSGTTVSSYSWDTTHLNHASSITGTSTSRLQFAWIGILSPATDYVTLTVTGTGGATEVQTYYFHLSPSYITDNTGQTWPESLAPNTVLDSAPAFGSHNASVDANSGALNTQIALPSYNPGIAPLMLAYNSLAADPRPVIVEHHTLDSSLTTPTKVSAQLTFNSGSGSTYYYDSSPYIPGDVMQIGLQANATALATGRYNYTITLDDVRGSTTTTTVNGTATVVNEASNPIGAGWTIAGLESIKTATGGVILNLGGGNSLWFTTGAGSTYTNPAGEFSTLVANSGGGYTRTLTDGTALNFNSSGQETTVVDRNGLTTAFAYTSGALTTITDPYGKVTTLTYSGGVLATIIDPASRVATFTHSSGNLTGVTLPDSSTWGYSYDGSKRLTQVTDPNSKTVTVAYDSAERVATITRPDSTTEEFVAYQERGYDTTGTSGSPAAATLFAEARASHTDPLGHVTDMRPDWNGLGQIEQMTDPDGNVATLNNDGNGLTAVAIDRLNRITQYNYDAHGNVTTLTYADGNHEQFSYNGFSEVTTHTDANNHTTTLTYDGNGNNTVIKDALNNLTTMTYTGNGQVATVKDARSNTTSYAYDSQDRLTTVTNPDASTQLTAYDTKGNATTVTDERGNVATATYDAMNRPTGATDALGNHTTIVYDNAGNRTAVQAPLSRTTSYAYDAMNRVTTITDPLSHATVAAYDSGGNLKTVTDPLSRVTTFAYDPENRRTVVTDPLSHSTTIVYDAEGQVIKVTDALSRVTTTTYNSRGWVSTVTDPLGNVATHTYTPTGKPASSYVPASLGSVFTNYSYDANDRLTNVNESSITSTSFGFDAVGNRISVTDGNSHTTTYAYDSRNRITTITDALSDNTVLGYDSGGNRTTVTDPNGHVATTAYDALNRATTITDAVGNTTTMAFDSAGRMSGLTDPNGNHTTWAYDAANRVTTLTSPNGSTTTYVYDNANQLTDKTDQNGRRVTFAYDSGGRQTGETWVSASPAETVTSTFDADNELTAQSDGFATLTYTYDSGGRMVTAATSSSGGQPSVTLTTGYDPSNNRATLVDNLASVGRTTFSYDLANRLTTIAASYGGGSGPQVVMGYDAGNRMTSESRTIGGSGTQVNTTFSYDNANRVTTITHGSSVYNYFPPGWINTALATYTYGYDSGGRVTAETNAEGAVSYTYDNANQLTGVSGARAETYTYDSGGNRTMAGYATTTGNEMTSGGGYTYAYDSAGNMTGKTLVSNGDNWTYTWDYRNRLTGVVEHASGGSVLMQGTYTYDSVNRRIGVDETVSGVETKTWTVYDGANVYADFNGSGTLQQRYLCGPMMDQMLARTSSGGTTAWYLVDRLGTIRDITDTSGTVLDHLGYDSFGTVTIETTPANGDKFKFAGLQYDSATNLSLALRRALDSTTGRWISEDPIDFRGGDANLYRYIHNSPQADTDPSGLAPPNDLPRGASPFDLVLPNPRNTVVFIGPDLPDPQWPRSHEVLYPRFYQNLGVPPNQIFLTLTDCRY